MPWNGSGIVQHLYNWVADRDASIPITASRMDAEMNDMAAEIQNCIAKDGQNTATGNLPMGGFRHSGVGNATNRNHYAVAGQIQDNSYSHATDSGSSNSYVITLAPAITAYAAGQRFSFIAGNSNTSESTLNVNGVGAKNIYKNVDEPLIPNDILENEVVDVIYDGTNFQIIKDKYDAEFDSLASLLSAGTRRYSSRITSYYGGWTATAAGPKGGAYWHKTGATAANPSVGSAVTGYESSGKIGGGDGTGLYTGTAAQAGYAWDKNGNEWRISLSNEIYCSMFGAKGDYDGVTGTDDSLAIQGAIDFTTLVKESGSGVKTIGSKQKVYLDAGAHLVQRSLYIDDFYLYFEGIGFSSLIAGTSIESDEFILEIGTQVRVANARSDGTKVRNIRFGRHQSNPYESNYSSATFGSGAGYTFTSSCGAIKVNRSHAMSEIDWCVFVGMRIGIILEGAYLFNIRNCHFSYNNRHIEGFQDNADNVSNNDQVIDNCIFGTSVLNGGVWLEQFDGLRISHFDAENSQQCPFYFYQCRSVYLEHIYFENNNRYFGSGSIPSDVFSSTPFHPTSGDAVPSAYAGYNMVFQACQSVSILHYVSSTNNTDYEGEILNVFCQNPIDIENANLKTNLTSTGYYFDQYSTTETGFTLESIQASRFYHRLISNETAAIVRKGKVGGDTESQVPTNWYIDFDSGDDSTRSDQMDTDSRLRTLNLRAIPMDDDRIYNVYVKGSTDGIVLPPISTRARINIIGESTPDVGRVRVTSGGSYRLENLDMEFLARKDLTGISAGEMGPSFSSVKLDNVSVEFNSPAGFIQGFEDSKFYMSGCTVTQNNAVTFSLVAVNGNQVWYTDHTIANSKVDEARDFGRIYYDASALTGSAPIVASGTIGQVISL